MPEKSENPRKVAVLSTRSPTDTDYQYTYDIRVLLQSVKISNYRALDWLFITVQVRVRVVYYYSPIKNEDTQQHSI